MFFHVFPFFCVSFHFCEFFIGLINIRFRCARAVARKLQAARTALCPDVMSVHSDTTRESARCLHADGFQNYTSNGLSQRVSVVIRLKATQDHKCISHSVYTPQSLGRHTTSVREGSVEQAGARELSGVQVTPHIVGLVALCTGTRTLSHQRSKLIHL